MDSKKSGDRIRLIVHDQAGQFFYQKVHPNDTGSTLKELIANTKNIPVNDITFEGNIVKYNATLASQGIQDNNRIDIIPGVVGGV